MPGALINRPTSGIGMAVLGNALLEELGTLALEAMERHGLLEPTKKQEDMVSSDVMEINGPRSEDQL